MILCALFRRRKVDKVEQEKQNRLEAAEAEMKYLLFRARRAEQALTDRQRRNHWQDSINRMIREAGKST